MNQRCAPPPAPGVALRSAAAPARPGRSGSDPVIKGAQTAGRSVPLPITAPSGARPSRPRRTSTAPGGASLTSTDLGGSSPTWTVAGPRGITRASAARTYARSHSRPGTATAGDGRCCGTSTSRGVTVAPRRLISLLDEGVRNGRDDSDLCTTRSLRGPISGGGYGNGRDTRGRPGRCRWVRIRPCRGCGSSWCRRPGRCPWPCDDRWSRRPRPRSRASPCTSRSSRCRSQPSGCPFRCPPAGARRSDRRRPGQLPGPWPTVPAGRLRQGSHTRSARRVECRGRAGRDRTSVAEPGVADGPAVAEAGAAMKDWANDLPRRRDTATNVCPTAGSGRSGLLLPAVSLGLWQNFGDDVPLRSPARHPAPGLRSRRHPLRPGQQLRPALRLGGDQLRPASRATTSARTGTSW